VQKIHLVPAQGDELGDPQSMPVGDGKHQGIAAAVPVDLARRQVLTRAPRTVGFLRRSGATFPFTVLGRGLFLREMVRILAMSVTEQDHQ